MDIVLLPETMGYKANLHSHTTDSDGYFTPEELKELYRGHGYSILAYTDHLYMRDRTALNDENFVALNGYENNIFDHMGKGIESKCYHLNFYSPKPDQVGMVGITEYFYKYYMRDKTREEIEKSPVLNGFLPSDHSVAVANEAIRQAKEQGYLVIYNHPQYNLHTDSDYIGLRGLTGVEVMNYNNYVNGCIENDVAYERMLRAGQRAFPIAGDDNHNLCKKNRAFDSFGGFNVMYPKKLDYESVFECLKTGNFYASEGALIRGVSVCGDKVTVGAENAAYINLSTNGRAYCMELAKEKALTSATFSLPEDIRYFRITIADERGKKAYTRAYFTDEFNK